jgi:hypothetical protein
MGYYDTFKPKPFRFKDEAQRQAVLQKLNDMQYNILQLQARLEVERRWQKDQAWRKRNHQPGGWR